MIVPEPLSQKASKSNEIGARVVVVVVVVVHPNITILLTNSLPALSFTYIDQVPMPTPKYSQPLLITPIRAPLLGSDPAGLGAILAS